jgi:hypothetical protein
MAAWVNEVRPAGNPKRAEADILTPECYADGLDAAFQERVRLWSCQAK